MFAGFFDPQARRKRLLKKTKPGPLHDFYHTPFVSPKTQIRDIELVALDLETTGLDTGSDHVVSVGLVHLRNLTINLGTAWYQVVYTHQDMDNPSTTIHHITDDTVGNGISISALMPTLLQHLAGKVLLAHHHQTETGFLNTICQSLYQNNLVMPVIDTRTLANRLLKRQQQLFESSDLRLFNLRERYKLPTYKAHNAFYDALTTAELFLALFNDSCPKHDCRLKHYLSKY